MKKLLFLIEMLAIIGLSVSAQKESRNTIPSNWKTYTNNKLGYTFQYPGIWFKNGKDAEVVNLSGTVTAVETNFIDTVSKTTLIITYHLTPKGTELYQYVVSQYDSSKVGKQIEVAGNKAIKTFTTISKNGKGKMLNPPLRSIVVDFLDKKQTGEIELQFKTPITNEDSEITKFNQLLTSFQFNN